MRRKVNHKTPLPMVADAYTIGSEDFASPQAKRKSYYYLTFRRLLEKIDPNLYKKGDNRIVFYGLSKIIDYLFGEKVTMDDVLLTQRSLTTAKATAKGLAPYPFPAHIWKRIVEDFNGQVPIRIRAVKEGSIVYPNEPVITIENVDDKFTEGEMGEMAAWFESTLIKVWSMTEMVTQLAHWFEYCKSVVTRVYGKTKSEDEKNFFAGLMLQNFGCRAGMTPQESEWLGEAYLLIFGGTDTFSGGFQAWMNSRIKEGKFVSIPALAHRNIQGYENEDDCFQAIFDSIDNDEFEASVGDCYSFYDAVERKLLQLAIKSQAEGLGKVIVGRPDSGDAKEQVLWMCKLAHKNGLSTTEKIEGKEWRFATTLKFIEGDGMRWDTMKEIIEELLLHGFAPFSFGLFGVGGGLRNAISRDNLSTKYALCAVGVEKRPVCKFSETLEKTTLPGPFKLLRSAKALADKKTIIFAHEEGEDVLVDYYDGSDLTDPFKDASVGGGYGDYFDDIQTRIKNEWATMPKTLTTDENHNYPASDAIRDKRIELLHHYAPKKLAQNY